MLCATYLINRMSLESLGNTTPYFKLYNIAPSLNHLRNFSYLCYVSTSQVQRSKFHSRAYPAVFLGYHASQKGYKILDLVTNQVQVSRNVNF